MPRALSSVRLDEHATFRYVLFVEGWPRAYTTDSSGALVGSGLGSWVYTSELNAGSREVGGQREVVPGLIIPDEVVFSVDMRTGLLEPNPVTFRLLDLDGELADFFASEGKESVSLAQRIAPGTTNLGASVQVAGGGTTNPRGRYVGIERIGPSGQRRFFPAIPFDLVGYDHPVHAGAEPPDGLPPVLISDEPIDHNGRLAALYRIYRDPDSTLPDNDPDAYYRWDEAEAAGDRVWWGVMRDTGSVAGNRVWALDFDGPDALMRKQLGTRNTVIRTKISADLTLADDESYVAILFGCRGVAGASVERTFDASVWDHQITAVTSRAALAAQINAWIEDALDGTDTNVAGPDGSFDGWIDAEGNANPDAGVTSEGRFFVRREAVELNDDLTYGVMRIAMHERAWNHLGFEPRRQHREAVTFADVATAYFEWLEPGDDIPGTGVTIPGAGYVLATFTTIAAGAGPDDIPSYTNDGGPRYWYPGQTASVFVLDRDGNQVIRLVDEEPTSLYLEGQLTAGVRSTAEIATVQTERARWFLLEGQVSTTDDDPATDDVEVTDAKDLAQIIDASWVEGTHYGTVDEGGDIAPALYVERYLDPRSFGVNHPRRRADWAGKAVGKGQIELTPLHAYHYALDDAPLERAVALIAQILLSTGACAGYDAPLDAGGEILPGPNTHTTPDPPLFEGDYELADLGCGIPYQLVQHPNEFRAALHTLPGGVDGDLCRLRLAYKGPFSALDALESITGPRQLCWSLAGKQLGVFRLGPVSPEDADIVVTEDDIYGTPGDPASTIPSQTLRATGQVDGVKLSYRWSPVEDSTEATWSLKALDPGAPRRSGELVVEVQDHGLAPVDWYKDDELQDLTGVGDWRPLFRQLWQRDVPTFFARRHFAATLVVSRPQGQDAMPGSAITLTSPWLVNPAGGYGVTGAAGRVTRATHNLWTAATTVDAIIFAVAGPLHYGPSLRVSGVTGTTVAWYEDHLGHGTDATDGTGFAEPDWSATGGTPQATVYQRNGDTWTAIVTRGVTSVNIGARTLVLDGAVTGYLRDKDHYLVISDYAAQTAGTWPRVLYGTAAGDDETIDGTIPATQHLG
jgi:hypothetical protein